MTAEFETVFTTVFIVLSVLSVVSFFVCLAYLFFSRYCVYYDGKERSFFFKKNAERYKEQIIEERKIELEEFKKKIEAM